MRRWSVPFLSVTSALLAIAILAPALGPVSGAIPNQGIYSACLTKATGETDIINYPKVKCDKGERLIRWSQEGPQGAQGPQGAPGAQGAQGAQGIQGAPGITKITLTQVFSGLKTVYGNSTGVAIASCPTGRVVGGGFTQSSINMDIVDSYPSGQTWTVQASNPAPNPLSLGAYAVCMTTDPSTRHRHGQQGIQGRQEEGEVASSSGGSRGVQQPSGAPRRHPRRSGDAGSPPAHRRASASPSGPRRWCPR